MAMATMEGLCALSSETSFSAVPTDSSSHDASLSSTPPTTVSPDSMSLASEADHHKSDHVGHNVEVTDAVIHTSTDNSTSTLLDAAIPLLEKANAEQEKNERDQEQQETPVPAQQDQDTTSNTTTEATSVPEQQELAKEGTPMPEIAVAQAIVVADADASAASTPNSASRPRRARSSLPVYNLAKLSGTDVHGKRQSKGDIVSKKYMRRSLTNGGELAPSPSRAPPVASSSTDTLAQGSKKLVQEGIEALNLDWSLPKSGTATSKTNTPKPAKKATTAVQKVKAAIIPQTTRRATRLASAPTQTLSTKISSLGKRSRKVFEKGVTRMSRELRRLQDTNEFAHIDTRPVRYTVWANGKYVDPEEEKRRLAAEAKAKAAAAAEEEDSDEEDEDAAGPARKKAKIDDAVESGKGSKSQESTDAGPATKKRRVKKWLDKGLYAGQEFPKDVTAGLTAPEKKKIAQFPNLVPAPGAKINKVLPPPIFNGTRLLLNGRDFKLPFDVCNPLPPGQPKPAQYRTITKNRFVGDAASYWKKTPIVEDFASKCVCTPEDGCGESCQNRFMLYECDESNCNVGKDKCTNRAFQDLHERIKNKKGARFNIGVEVLKTEDRGYGVRSNRCFEANQIIMEYTGEIITVDECERRMNEEYKNNECYYLMSFDQNMIIDATTGSIARFVNHSCNPNCRMIKWIVSGQPRMALFAGDNPIMAGDELTYDYNFDPFSAKNVQKCLCGSDNCRGVLGPKSREVKPPKPPKEEASAGKGKGKNGKGKAKGAVKGVVKSGKVVKAVKAVKGVRVAKGFKTAKSIQAAKAVKAMKGMKGAKGIKVSTQVKASVTAGKRKLKELFVGDDDEETEVEVDEEPTPKKAKLTAYPKRSFSSASLKVAKGAAKVVTKSVKSLSLKKTYEVPDSPVSNSFPPSKLFKTSKKTTKTTTTTSSFGKKSSANASKAFGKTGAAQKKTTANTIVAAPLGSTPLKKKGAATASLSVGRTRTPSRKVLESAGQSPASAAAKSPKPRKGLELSRGAKIRLVSADADE